MSKPEGLDWVQLEKDMSKFGTSETAWERIIRKSKDNPLVPIGVSVTVGALTYGVYSFYQGRTNMQQKMMRLRVGAQMFTIFAAVGGIYLSLPKEKRSIEGLIESGDPAKRWGK